MSKVYLKEIYLKNWRNISHAELIFSPDDNILLGSNAQGKTSLLEAMAILCTGRSFRTSRLEEGVKWGEESAYLKGKIRVRDVEQTVEVGIAKSRREVKVDGKVVSGLSRLLGRVPFIEFIPSDFAIVDSDPSTRRKFLDYYLSLRDTLYYRHLMDFTKALRQRNAQLSDKRFGANLDLGHWDDVLVQCGTYIIKKRAQFINKLSKAFIDVSCMIAPQDELASLKYESCIRINDLSFDVDLQEEEVAFRYKNRLNETMAADRAIGITTIGPHREDIKIFIGLKAARNYASQGQKRTIAIALKSSLCVLYIEETGVEPVCIVDDVYHELDEERKGHLKSILKGRQTFIAATSVGIADFKTAKRFQVKKGKYLECETS